MFRIFKNILGKIAIVFLVLAILALGGLLYLNKVFLPIQLKTIISQKSKEYLQRDISYQDIVFQPLKGIVIRKLVIFQKNNPQAPFFSVEEISARILVPSFFKEFQLLIPSITLTKPYLHLIRDNQGQWNYLDVLAPRKKSSDDKPFPVLLGGITVTDGRIQITNRDVSPISIEIWEKVNAKVNLSFNKNVKFDTELQNTSQKIFIKANGHYFFDSQDTDALVSIQNLDAAKYLNLFYPLPGWTIKTGFIENAQISLVYKKNLIEAHGSALLNADLKQAEERRLKGRINLQNLSLSKQKDKLDFTTQLDARDLSILWDRYALQGNIVTKNIQASGDEKNFTASGGLDLSQAAIVLPDGNSAKGDFSLTNLNFNKAENDFTLKANLVSPKAGLVFSGNTLEAGISLPSFSLDQHQGIFTARGELGLSNANVALAGDTKFSGNMNFKNMNFKGTADDYLASGDILWDKPLLATKTLKAKGDNLTLTLQALTKNKKTAITANPALTAAQFNFGPGQNLTANTITAQSLIASISDGKILLKTSLLTDQIVYPISKDQGFQGNPQIKAEMNYDPQNPEALNYQGTISLANATFKGAPGLGDIQQINGLLNFSNDSVSTDKLNLLALKTSALISGGISNFADPKANITVRAENVDLATLGPFLKPYLEKANITPTTGQADIKVTVNGPIEQIEKAKITGVAILRAVTLSGKALPSPIADVAGILRYSPDQLSWENLRGVWNKARYTLNGELQNFAKPSIALKVDSEDLIMNTKFKFADNLIFVSSCSGRFRDTGFNVTGKVQLKDNADPFLDVAGHLSLNLADLPDLNPAWKDLKASHPAGDVLLDFTFKGRAKNFTRAKMSLSATSPQVSFNTYKLRDLAVNFDQGESDTGKLTVTGNFYNGELKIDGFTNIQNDPMTFNLNGQLTGTGLAAIRSDGKWKGQEVSGSLSALMDLNGPATNMDQWQGKFSFLIKDGVLWEMNLLKGIFKALLISELGNISFTDASANFTIRDGKMMTNDLFFKGSLADMMGRGWISLKGDLHLDITPKFKQLELAQSGSILKAPTTLLANTEGLNIKVTGTLKNPQYSVNSLPTKILQKGAEGIMQGVQGLIEGILDQ